MNRIKSILLSDEAYLVALIFGLSFVSIMIFGAVAMLTGTPS
jgi:hypothetical protein